MGRSSSSSTALFGREWRSELQPGEFSVKMRSKEENCIHPRKPSMENQGAEERKAWATWIANRLIKTGPQMKAETGQLFRCPCCRCRTLAQRGANQICPVCFWEDDGQDDSDADVVRGSNGKLSLTVARENYIQYGACESKFVAHVRAPLPEETDADYSI
jgi:hypothetical protein